MRLLFQGKKARRIPVPFNGPSDTKYVYIVFTYRTAKAMSLKNVVEHIRGGRLYYHWMKVASREGTFLNAELNRKNKRLQENGFMC